MIVRHSAVYNRPVPWATLPQHCLVNYSGHMDRFCIGLVCDTVHGYKQLVSLSEKDAVWTCANEDEAMRTMLVHPMQPGGLVKLEQDE